MKNQKYHAVATVSKSNIKIEERVKTDISITQGNDYSLSWLGAYISIKKKWRG